MENIEMIDLEKKPTKSEKTAKIVMWIVISVVVVALAVIGIFALKPAYVAKAGEYQITEDEFNFFLSGIKSQMLSYAGEGIDPEELFLTEYEGERLIDSMKKNALSQAVEFKVQLVKANEEGMIVPQDRIDSFNADMEEQFQIYADRYNLTVDQVSEDMYDIAFQPLQDIYKDLLLVEDFASEQIDLLILDEQDMIDYYEENKEAINNCAVRHVLILADAEAEEADKAEALEKAEEILAKAEAGDNFDALVVEFSEDPGKESNDGEYFFTEDGYSSTGGTLVEEFVNWSFENEEGAMGIVTTEYGYHVMLLDRKRATYELNAESIEIILKQDEYYNETVAGWAAEDGFVADTTGLYDKIQ